MRCPAVLLVSCLSFSSGFGQNIELFVETGTPIVGEPGNRSLGRISSSSLGVTEGGIVVFTGYPGNDDAFTAILKVEEPNQIQYLLGNGPFGDGGTTLDLLDDEEHGILINEFGNFTFMADLRNQLNPELNQDSVLFIGDLSDSPDPPVMIDTEVLNTIQLTGNGEVLYTTDSTEDQFESLKLGTEDREATITLIEELSFLPNHELLTTYWDNVAVDNLSAYFQESENFLVEGKVFFSNEIYEPLIKDDGESAFVY